MPSMRLLQLRRDDFSLVEYNGEAIPRYAILSHTWGADDEEVNLKDIRKGIGKNKPGYRKLIFCGKQAMLDGLEFFWIDTCCIDKSSSNELAQAMNSMFQWYHQALKCYVYLSDVSISESVSSDLVNQQTWMPAFQGSKWFTRCWTLQELLAPKSVDFFSAEGERLGHRLSLQQEIHKATGIPIEALQGKPLSLFSVEERRLWAASRQSKREEDAAYSLLGIFDIHMSPIYGEGQKNAFARMERKIKKSCESQSSATPSLRSPTNVEERVRSSLHNDSDSHDGAVADISDLLKEHVNDKQIATISRLGRDELGGPCTRRGTVGHQVVMSQNTTDSLSDLSAEEILQLLRKIRSGTRLESLDIVNDWLGIARHGDRYDMAQVFDKQISSHLEGTCEWIFLDPDYQAWRSDEHTDETAKILWIHAPTGYGKTVLCAKLVEHLKSMHSFTVAYFFASPHAQSAGEPTFIIRSWIAQLAQLDLKVLDLVRRQSKAGQRATDSVIWSLFGSILSENRNCAFVLDGFDKYDRLEDVRTEFLQKLKETTKRTPSRILIMSRYEMDISAELSSKISQGKEHIILQRGITSKDVRHDVSQFSRTVVDKRLPNKDDRLRQDLANQLTEKCHGMFLWIKLQQDQLRGGKNAKQLQNIIENMPSGLPKTYERNWKIIQSRTVEEQHRALIILRWITFALRPLTVSEITEALVVELDDSGITFRWDDLPDEIDDEYIKSEIIDICGALVEVRTDKPGAEAGSRTVNLIHPSVQEFLLSGLHHTPADSPQHTVEPDKAPTRTGQHKYLATVCLGYLDCDDAWKRQTSENADEPACSFINYAARYWNSHLTVEDKNDPELICLVNDFFRSENENFSHWRRYIETSQATSDASEEKSMGTATPLYYAALFNLPATMQHIWTEDPSQLDRVGGEYGTPLQAVCHTGHEEACKMLLDWGANPDVVGGRFGLAISAAVAMAHRSIVKTLISAGANLALQDSMGRTPLYTAATNGECDIVDTLIEAGADWTTPDKHYWTPLKSASKNGHFEIVKLLLEKGASIDIACDRGWTPLNSASDNGHLEVVRLLLDNGASVDIASESGWTPLSSASNNGHLEVVRLLLEKGADANLAIDGGSTPLDIAPLRGYLKIVEMLLEKGADIDPTVKGGWTPLHRASLHGHLRVVKLLLEKGADPNLTNNAGWTPLKSASSEGHPEVVELLLNNGANIDIASNIGWTPLHLASNRGHLGVVELLLKRGADVSLMSTNGWTPLDVASEEGHLKVVQLLLEKELNINNTDLIEGSIFHKFASKGYTDLLELAYERYNADQNVVERHGRSPLHLAARGGHLQTLHYLLSLGVNPGLKDMNGDGLLRYASSGGSLQVLSVVLDIDPISSLHCKNWSPIHWACRAGESEVVERLVQEGLQSECVTSPLLEGPWDPVSIAIFHGNERMLEKISEPCRSLLNTGAAAARLSGSLHGTFECDGCLHVSELISLIERT